MSPLLDSLANTFTGSPTQKVLLNSVIHDGLPERSEAWKYTSLRQLERRRFVVAKSPASLDEALLSHIPAPRIVFVNGSFHAELSLLDSLPEGLSVEWQAVDAQADTHDAITSDAVFTRLNMALAKDVLHIRAQAQATTPLYLVTLSTPHDADQAWHQQCRIEVDEAASLTLIEHEIASDEHAHLSNTLSHIHVQKRAHLSHVRLQNTAVRATVFSRTDATLEDDAQYTRIDLELGAGLSRNELNVSLRGDRAKLTANGVLLADGRRHVDTRLGIQHQGKDTACQLVWRGLANQRGRVVFHGGIVIHAGADGTVADLSNKNLLLSANAEIDTQPTLVIDADEVQAAHGATVGQLDSTSLFYLRSRGLPEAQARAMLTGAFCQEVVDGIDDATARSHAEAALQTVLPRLGA